MTAEESMLMAILAILCMPILAVAVANVIAFLLGERW